MKSPDDTMLAYATQRRQKTAAIYRRSSADRFPRHATTTLSVFIRRSRRCARERQPTTPLTFISCQRLTARLQHQPTPMSPARQASARCASQELRKYMLTCRAFRPCKRASDDARAGAPSCSHNSTRFNTPSFKKMFALLLRLPHAKMSPYAFLYKRCWKRHYVQ